MLDLPAEHLAEARQLLRIHLPGYRVCAFGSRVTGKARRFSDLDLAVMTTTPLDWRALEALKDAFAESGLPFMVDVLDWAATAETFRQAIAPQLVMVQEAVGALSERNLKELG